MTSAAGQLTKLCGGVCKRELRLSAFTRDASREDGRARMCRDCEPIRLLITMKLFDDGPRAFEQDTTRAMTFQEIGDVMKISAQRVQAIEATAIRKLKNNMRVLSRVRELLSR